MRLRFKSGLCVTCVQSGAAIQWTGACERNLVCLCFCFVCPKGLCPAAHTFVAHASRWPARRCSLFAESCGSQKLYIQSCSNMYKCKHHTTGSKNLCMMDTCVCGFAGPSNASTSCWYDSSIAHNTNCRSKSLLYGRGVSKRNYARKMTAAAGPGCAPSLCEGALVMAPRIGELPDPELWCIVCSISFCEGAPAAGQACTLLTR